MPRRNIRVIIVDDGRTRACDAGCGPDWSSPDVIGQAGIQIKARFGDRVSLKYIDPSAPRQEALRKRIANEELLLPLLLINSEPRISGEFDLRMVMDAIQAELEING